MTRAAPLVRAVVTLVVIGLALVARARTASADEERPVRFALAMEGEVTPLDACGGEQALASSVEQRLRRPVFVPAEAADIAFLVSFEGSEAHIVEHDRLAGDLGRRDVPLPSEDCERALDTMAVVLAIMIGPEQRMTTAPPPPPLVEPRPPEPPPASRPPPPRDVRPASPPAPAAPRKRPLRWSVGLLGELAVGSGILPGVAWAIEGGVIVTPPVPRLFAIARGAYWPAQATGLRPAAEVDRAGGALLGCLELVRGAEATLSACAGVDAGRLSARSASLSRASEQTLILGVLAEARFGYRFRARGPIVIEPAIAAQIDALLRRDRFTYRDGSGRELTLLQPAPVAVQTNFGVAVHFL